MTRPRGGYIGFNRVSAASAYNSAASVLLLNGLPAIDWLSNSANKVPDIRAIASVANDLTFDAEYQEFA